ncbi:UNVERIFIED_CONTAM: hypothetical protein FKN15_073774 [Acipenser sinensis]
MLPTAQWCPKGECSLKPRWVKVAAIYTVMLLVSLSFTAAQSSTSGKHHVDNRNPDIDPFWYVGRGVRPIGRFGKRQMNNISNLTPAINTLEFILSSFRNKEVRSLDQTLGGGKSHWLP